LGTPEQTLTGVQYVTYGDRRNDNDFIVNNSDHWIYNNTGLADGDRIRGIVGIEVDQVFEALPGPQSQEFTVIGRSRFQGAESRRPSISESVVYQALSGAWVFASGTLLWSPGLSQPDLRSDALRTKTKNLLDRFAGNTDQSPPGISVKALSVSESAGEAKVEINLSRASSNPVKFSFVTRDNTAKQGQNFYGLYRVSSISAGESTTRIPVTILRDDQREDSETFFVRIFRVDGAELGDSELTVTITDSNSNSSPKLEIEDVTVSESVGFAKLRVTLDRPVEDSAQVDYATQSISAELGVDYFGVYGTLSFDAGETQKTIDIQVLDDNATEPDETLTVRLFNPVGASIEEPRARLTLKNDD